MKLSYCWTDLFSTSIVCSCCRMLTCCCCIPVCPLLAQVPSGPSTLHKGQQRLQRQQQLKQPGHPSKVSSKGMIWHQVFPCCARDQGSLACCCCILSALIATSHIYVRLIPGLLLHTFR
jgi:hypothetical protein